MPPDAVTFTDVEADAEFGSEALGAGAGVADGAEAVAVGGAVQAERFPAAAAVSAEVAPEENGNARVSYEDRSWSDHCRDPSG